jgi:hypothetical protein
MLRYSADTQRKVSKDMALRVDLVELRSVSGTEENFSGVEIEFRGGRGGMPDSGSGQLVRSPNLLMSGWAVLWRKNRDLLDTPTICYP